jgi:hypothetical protein
MKREINVLKDLNCVEENRGDRLHKFSLRPLDWYPCVFVIKVWELLRPLENHTFILSLCFLSHNNYETRFSDLQYLITVYNYEQEN